MPRGIEFMHEMDGLDSLDRYFNRQARRYRPLQISAELSTIFILQESMPRTQRAIQSDYRTQLDNVLQGYYYRVSDTFLTYGGTREQAFMAQYANTDIVRERLESSAYAVRNSYVHDETNTARNVAMCQSNNYWNIHALNLIPTATWSSASGIMCIGCGMGGTINRLDRDINQ